MNNQVSQCSCNFRDPVHFQTRNLRLRWMIGKIKKSCVYVILLYLNILIYGDLIETNRKWWIWGPRGKTKNQFEKTKQQIHANPGFPMSFASSCAIFKRPTAVGRNLRRLM